MPKVTGLDHVVLTVVDIAQAVRFYTDVLGMRAEVFHPADGTTRTALVFGQQKINLHSAEAPFAPHAAHPVCGSADICLLTDAPLDDWMAYFARYDIAIVAGPVARTGATGPIMSLYLRDPDGNLIEIAVPQQA